MKLSVFLGSAILLASTACSPSRFPQTMELADGTKIRMEAAWLDDCGSPKLERSPMLRVKFTYLGTNPNQRYRLHAAVRDRFESEDLQSQFIWQFGLQRKPNMPTNETPMGWEFRDYPTNSSKIYLRFYVEDKTNSTLKTKLEFVIPSAKLELRHGVAP